MKNIFTLLFAAAFTTNCAHAQNWLTTGNAGLTAANFLGTTDAVPLNLKVNNKQAGKIDYASAKANTSFGFQTLKSNSGAGNSAFGFQAMASNTAGFANTAAGQYSMQKNIGGNSNTAYGSQALQNNVSGYFNTAIGQASLAGSKGIDNTAVGRYAFISLTTGSGNTAVGSAANVSDSTLSNVTLLGYYTVGTASNQVRIGNDQVTSIGGYAGWTTLPSDGRVKKNIKANVPGLAFINKLKPLTYNLDLNAMHEIAQPLAMKTPEGKTIQPSKEELAAKKQKEQIVYTGFIAQDVQHAAKEIGYDFSGVDAAKNDKDLYGIRYAEFVVPLVKAVQELSKMNYEKNNKIEDLEARIQKLEAMMNVQKTTTSQQQSKVLNTSNAFLEKNTPNPFKSSTTINFNLPPVYRSAKIIITDRSGKVMKEAIVSANGKGRLQVEASALTSGTYNYSLYVDGKLIDTKQMLLSR